MMRQKKAKKIKDTNQTPTLGALILIYICGIGLIFLFSPSVIFYCSRYEVKGVVTEFNDSIAKVDFTDYKGFKNSIVLEREHRNNKIVVGKQVIVYYNKYNSKDFRVPIFQGNEPYLISLMLILMAVYAIFTTHRDYLNR